MGASLKKLSLFSTVCVLSVVSVAAADDLRVANDLRVVSAAQVGDRDAVRSSLKARADVNAAQGDGATALAWASYRNDLEIAELLIAAGAKPNAANEYGVTPLWLACANGSGPMVEKLLQGQADPNLPQWSGATPLMMCARTGNPEAVKLLLARGVNINAAESKQRQTALMWAASKSHPAVVQALIEGGADVNASTKGGSTALMFAAQQGDLASARLLVTAGANINAVTNAQATWVGDTPLLLAAASGHEALATFLLEKGADANAADEFGFTALHFSMMKSLVQVVGVRVGAPATLLWSTYLYRDNMPELVKALLAHGANPNARITKPLGGNKLLSTRLNDPSKFSVYEVGATPFLLAAHGHDTTIMRVLKKAGADPRLTTEGKATPLMIAAGLTRQRDFDALPYTAEDARKVLETVKLCVELGADVNAANDVGLTALHGAAFAGLNDVTRFLVQKGANLNAVDLSGQTPLHKAMNIKPKIGLNTLKNGHSIFVPFSYQKTTAELLLQLGATPVASPVVAQEANAEARASVGP
jgi:ankyrin repeat protein